MSSIHITINNVSFGFYPLQCFIHTLFVLAIQKYAYGGFKYWNIIRKIAFILYATIGYSFGTDIQALFIQRVIIFYASIILFNIINNDWWNKRKIQARNTILKARKYLAQGIPARYPLPA
jgi:hypothetical protein